MAIIEPARSRWSSLGYRAHAARITYRVEREIGDGLRERNSAG